ncbi:MAG: LLM class flavin-dependent oxidoreductase [Chloroflexi bacterium]|nr:LLM class flavin-dependent oxidoreductase [Chloroflexota bacterium]
MSPKIIGVEAMGGDCNTVLERIRRLEEMGIKAAWLTDGGVDMDAPTLLAAAAVQTDEILLGTAIVPTWPRHPITMVQQTQVLADLAPGRFRLGLGPSHRAEMEGTFGFDFQRPLTNLREYLRIVKALLQEGKVDFEGHHYRAHASTDQTAPDLPVMASALRRASFKLCGAEADGAISWVCPGEYLRDVALPAMREGAEEAGRQVPPLITHAAVCVHDDPDEVRTAALEDLEYYPKSIFYQRMFADAGFPEAEETETWSDRMLDAVVISGSEETVAERLGQLFEWGAGEVLASVLGAGADKQACWERTVRLLAQLNKSL